MRDPLTQRRATALRSAATDAERHLWQRLRGRQIEGARFRRQYPIEPFIADFMCLERRLIVEIDGGQHADGADRGRDAYLEARGYRVLRFWNNEVLTQTEAVVAAIHAALVAPIPTFPRKRGKEQTA